MSQSDGSDSESRSDSDGEAPSAAEQELLAAFDRLSPQGSLRWGFDDAMGRIEHADLNSAGGVAPWRGLPDDLWQRGHSARIGQRFVGDVAGVLADILASDARSVADAAVSSVNVAVWDALRHLVARVEILEARTDPLGLETAEWPLPVPDPSEWVGVIGTWLGSADRGDLVVVGEVGDGALVSAAGANGRQVVGVEPRGATAWGTLTSPEEGPRVDIVLGEVVTHLRTLPDDGAAAVVLVGCVDRVDLAAKVELLDHSLRVVRAGGTVVVLTTDPSLWDEALEVPTCDLLPGRPLHPETWCWLLERAGHHAVWHPPASGTLHAVVATVERVT
jgi:hypothetical protein